ncbi:GcvT family protein [Granulosicoccus sp. 3-233]|uniref:GcvT family protein n=1 Tax=Granulosicoccus sp. 3-233 TaxID=3417969 RepID=UPI003D33B2F9
MKSQARVVIIGGGVAGTSALYHLAQRGWTDCMLLEMDELTSGSTWHAAGNIPTFSSSRNIIKLQHYSTQLYARLCDDPLYPINYHQTGSIRLAQTRQRMEEFRHVSAMANTLGLEYEILDTAEMKARHPFLQDHELLGALWDPVDGDIDPSQLTQALAAHARKAGASIHRFTRVTGISRMANGEWKIATDKGDVIAEYVVNAGGYRGAEVARLGGRFLPLVTMEHQYLVTESIPELEATEGLLPLVRDPDDSYYLRQEKTGLILGPYEMKATARWKDGGIPEKFAYELYPDDLDRLEWYIEKACERMPILGSVGVQRVINGPIPYTPDGAPYIGPAFGLPNFFHVTGFSFGICQGGGAGKSIAEWIIDGKPEWDLWNLDPRRYTDYADQDYVVDRAIELYQHEYAINYPVEERPAGRPRKVSPCYDRLQAKGARFGARGGWERATWFAREQDTAEESPSYQHGVWFDAVGQECRNVRDNVGLLDLSGFSRFELKGEGASDWLNTMIAGRLPGIGRVGLSYFCAESGGVWSEMTVTRLAAEHYWLISAAAAKWHDSQWLTDHLPAQGGITVSDISDEHGTLVVAGPRSRDVLQTLTDTDLSNEAFRWLTCQPLELAGIQVQALRVNYVGELGWELHVPAARQLALYDALMEAGSAHDMQDFGMYAMESMRLEKSYRAWKVDLDHEYSPLRSGLDRFVDLNKTSFIGKESLLQEAAAGLPDVFATFVLDKADVAGDDAERINATDALYGCPVHRGDELVGYITSGGFGHRIGQSLALGYIRPELAVPGTAVEINVLGHRRSATVVAESPYDPDNKALRDQGR